MKRRTAILLVMVFSLIVVEAKKKMQVTWPDGTVMATWFSDTTKVDVEKLGRQYIITDYGVSTDSNLIQTKTIQTVIDHATNEGGGVIVVPCGTFLSGSLFFRKGTHLHVVEGGCLKGSDAIANYEIIKTRLEGQTIDYFAALINADGVDGFTITGCGTIDGNGRRFYEEFWLRRKVNPQCTNLEALRPRLVYIANSNDVTLQDVHLVNSGFWTNHLYRCQRARFLNCDIYAPTSGYPKGPSTDAIDLDGCSDVLIRDCYMNVNDDAVCLKGGKGTFVDKDSMNAPCRNILVEKCRFGQSNSGVTFGSESWDDSNVIMRNCEFNGTSTIVLFKMRPDTPQKYINVLIENITGIARRGVVAEPWNQFYNLLKRDDMPRSGISNVTLRNINVTCTNKFYAIKPSDKYDLECFTFDNIKAQDTKGGFDTSFIKNCKVRNVSINGKAYGNGE